MPRWSKVQAKFRVNLHRTNRGSYRCTLPKPVMESLGYPNELVYELRKDGTVVVYPANQEEE